MDTFDYLEYLIIIEIVHRYNTMIEDNRRSMKFLIAQLLITIGSIIKIGFLINGIGWLKIIDGAW